MGIDPITYKPWSGERTSTRNRVFIIAETFFRQKLKSKWVLTFLILGSILVFVFPIISSAMIPHDTLDASTMTFQMSDWLFFIFTILLAALICSDSIAEDLRSNSFVLYFSRAIKAESYLAGKMGGTILTLSLFCFIPPMLLAIVIMGTQSGSSYGASLGVFGRTIIASIVATLFFIPFSVLISSLTTRKSYAAVGTFMAFFVPTIISAIFTEFDPSWRLIDPRNVLAIFYDSLYGFGIPSDINLVLFSVMFIGFTLIPLNLLYLRIRMKAVGK